MTQEGQKSRGGLRIRREKVHVEEPRIKNDFNSLEDEDNPGSRHND